MYCSHSQSQTDRDPCEFYISLEIYYILRGSYRYLHHCRSTEILKNISRIFKIMTNVSQWICLSAQMLWIFTRYRKIVIWNITEKKNSIHLHVWDHSRRSRFWYFLVSQPFSDMTANFRVLTAGTTRTIYWKTSRCVWKFLIYI